MKKLEERLDENAPIPSQDNTSGYSSIGEFYFKPRSFERWKEGVVYKALGIEVFKRIIPTSGTWISKYLWNWHPIRHEPDREQGLKNYEKFTRATEMIHQVIQIMYASEFIDALSNENTGYAWFTGVSNLFVNVYPIMLQRYNRARIYNSLDRIAVEKRKGNKAKVSVEK